MDPVVHFEMPFMDRERMAKFYRYAFGWKTEMLGEDMGNYVLATTVETGEKGPKRPGAINGGFYQKNPEWPAQYPSILISVADIRIAIAKVAAAGGSVLGEPMEIPGVGSYVSFMDPEGNRVSMLQDIPVNWHAPKKKTKKKVAKKKIIIKKKVTKKKVGKKRKAGRKTAGKRS